MEYVASVSIIFLALETFYIAGEPIHHSPSQQLWQYLNVNQLKEHISCFFKFLSTNPYLLYFSIYHQAKKNYFIFKQAKDTQVLRITKLVTLHSTHHNSFTDTLIVKELIRLGQILWNHKGKDRVSSLNVSELVANTKDAYYMYVDVNVVIRFTIHHKFWNWLRFSKLIIIPACMLTTTHCHCSHFRCILDCRMQY